MSIASAATVSTSHSWVWDRARNLGVGQSVLSVQTNYQRIQGYIGSDGLLRGLGEPYSLPITWADVIEASDSAIEARELQSYLERQGLAANTVAAYNHFDISQEQLVLTPSWSYGLLSDWMVGVRLPLVWTQTEVSVRAERANAPLQVSPHARDEELERQVDRNILQARSRVLAAAQFDPVEGRSSKQALGDAELLSQVQLVNKDAYVLAFQQVVVWPTGQSAKTYEYIPTVSSEGAISLGLGLLADWWWSPLVTSVHVNYRHYVADDVTARVPHLNAQSPLEASVDRNVQRQVGGQWSSAINTEYQWSSNWSMEAGYTYWQKLADHYSGSEAYDYASLAKDSDSVRHIGRMGVAYFLESFTEQSRRLHQRLGVRLNYYTVLGGINTQYGSVAALETFFSF